MDKKAKKVVILTASFMIAFVPLNITFTFEA